MARSVLEAHGSKLTPEAQRAAIGRRPLEAWQATIDALGLQGLTAQQLFDESELLLKSQCACTTEHACLINVIEHGKYLTGMHTAQVGACTAHARGGAPALAPAQARHPRGPSHQHLTRHLRAQDGWQGRSGAHRHLSGGAHISAFH